MDSSNDSGIVVHKIGFTTLHGGESNPDVDIIFVHGLNGHPKKSWTYRSGPKVETKEISFKKRFRKVLRFRRKRAKSSNADPSPENEDVFWPSDLLSNEPWAQRARILTYGYDADVFRIVDNVNFSTISSHGESLLNALARVRADCARRPLMFIVHSLGGLVVKSALNQSAIHDALDLRQVLESTFATIFFGTPHRGSGMADFGLAVAKVASILTSRPYNANIVSNLGQNNELLTNLRRDFRATTRTMVRLNHYESTTFQESKGYSGVPGFQGKIVEDDACEMEDNNRNDHINENHINMIKFFGEQDPEYQKVSGEVRRHLQRLQHHMDTERANFLKNLSIGGNLALERIEKNKIPKKTDRTLEWLYGAKSNAINEGVHEGDSPIIIPPPDLKTWLRFNSGIFWIRGKPGSGKSTSMRYLFESSDTRQYLGSPEPDSSISSLLRRPMDRIHKQPKPTSLQAPEWAIIGFFVTNRGSEEQNRWRPLLLGMLHQLLKQKTQLIPGVITLLNTLENGVHPTTQQLGSSEIPDEQWQLSTETLEEVLTHCKEQHEIPCRVLIIIDGIDELASDDDIERCIKFLQRLCDVPERSSSPFKVCLSGRSEALLNELLSGVWSVEIHEHTYDDIRTHVKSRLKGASKLPIWSHKNVRQIVKYITANANGVFLWASSVCNIVTQCLQHGQSFNDAYESLTRLPKDVAELYSYTLRRIPPCLQLKAHIMLETVLRTRRPLTLLELHLVVHVAERAILGKSGPWNDDNSPNHPDPNEFLNGNRLQRLLISSCRCMLEVSSSDDYPKQTADDSLDRFAPPTAADDDDNENHPCGFDTERRGYFVRRFHDLGRIARNRTRRNSFSSSSSHCLEHDDGVPTWESNTNNRIGDFNLMESQQYHQFDPARATVRLIHRSARDFILDGGNLNKLLEACPTSTGSVPRPMNGHAYLLYFSRAWLKVPQNIKSQLRVNFDVIREVAHNAPWLEPTLGVSDAQPLFTVLDDLDRELTMSNEHWECWPLDWYIPATGDRGVSSWHFTFPAFAVSKGMQGYLQYRIANTLSSADRLHFLNGKKGRPLHFFAAFMPGEDPKLEMIDFLLENGANIHARFEGKTILESMVLHDERSDGVSEINIIELLLNHGADANSRYLFYPHRPPLFWPLLHSVARLSNIQLKDRLRLLELLYSKRADLNSVDCFGQTFAEVLYWNQVKIPAPCWEWIFCNGAKITKQMISEGFVNPLIRPSFWSVYPQGPWVWQPYNEDNELQLAQAWLNSRRAEWNELQGICDERTRQVTSEHDAWHILTKPAYRRREWYTDDAADAAEASRPGWFTRSDLESMH